MTLKGFNSEGGGGGGLQSLKVEPSGGTLVPSGTGVADVEFDTVIWDDFGSTFDTTNHHWEPPSAGKYLMEINFEMYTDTSAPTQGKYGLRISDTSQAGDPILANRAGGRDAIETMQQWGWSWAVVLDLDGTENLEVRVANTTDVDTYVYPGPSTNLNIMKIE